MKALDYLLLLGAVAFLVASYFVNSAGNIELASLMSLCATICGCIFGGRLGGRIHKKNQENK